MPRLGKTIEAELSWKASGLQPSGCMRLVPSVRLLVLCLWVTSGCAESAHQTGQARLDRLIPAGLMAEVDESVSFSDLRSDPGQYVGRTVMFSGLALQTKRTTDRTEIEILQLPTDGTMTPSDRKARSQGRFLAVQSTGFLDPAVIDKEAPVTVVGEVEGSVTRPLGEGNYHYPVLGIKQLIDWNDVKREDGYGSVYDGHYRGYYGPYSSWYYGFGSPFWGPYGFYPYPYYGYSPFYAFPRGYSAPAPSAPPPASVPPQFQKGS